MDVKHTHGYKVIEDWLAKKSLSPFLFQQKTWAELVKGSSGLVNAPTGYGKTFAVFLGVIIRHINNHPETFTTIKNNGLQLIWVSPLRALAKDIARSMQQAVDELNIPWKISVRNGDTPSSERQKQTRQMPEVLVITPESIHLLFTQKNHHSFFENLKVIAVDEWHELIGSKRGVQTELAIAYIGSIIKNQKRKNKSFMLWGISATIGNLNEAAEVLLKPLQLIYPGHKPKIIKSNIKKQIDIEAVIPDEVERYPWAGHLGLKLIDKVVEIIEQNNTTLVFINTRGMSEVWYQRILDVAPHLAGAIALHHGSIEPVLRQWVEEALHDQKLKAVICTSSLDLGVDFRPVDTVIQVGSPKGVARFLQRAGRSGHRPGDISKIYFLPTHSLELMEVAAIKTAVKKQLIEHKQPYVLCFDVLCQFMCTLAIGGGFNEKKLFEAVRSTFCFEALEYDEWQQCLSFITLGGSALQHYDEFKKVEQINGLYVIKNRSVALRHRLHIGTIVSDAMLKVKLISGTYVGMVEEWFVSRLNPGDTFTIAGLIVELVAIKYLEVKVKKSTATKAIVPSWLGGRMPLSSNLGMVLRSTLAKATKPQSADVELIALKPVFDLQQQLSHIPNENEILIELIETRDGFHFFAYPFEGRLVHEAMAALLALRISKKFPISFTMAMNDYGFELLCDEPFEVNEQLVKEWFSVFNLVTEIQQSLNAVEMARRKFRDIAVIGGLIFQGFPGHHKKQKHLQSSASLLFKVFNEFDENNLLVRQAYQEVLDHQMEEVRLRAALERINHSKIIIKSPMALTPFCFPIKVDSLRESLSSERLEDRIKKLIANPV